MTTVDKLIKKYASFGNKQVTPKGLLELAAIINKEYLLEKEKAQELKQLVEEKYVINDIDGSQYEYKNYQKFVDDNYISKKKVGIIRLSFYNINNKKEINIVYDNQGIHYAINTIEIIANNEDWVNAKVKQIEEEIANWEDQKYPEPVISQTISSEQSNTQPGNKTGKRKVTKPITIKNKIITSRNIISLASIFSSEKVREIRNSKGLGNRGILSFTLSDNNEMNIEYEDLETLKEDNYLELKKVVKVSLFFMSSDYNKKMRVSIYDSSYYTPASTVSIEGDDVDWVNAKVKQIEEEIANWEDQKLKGMSTVLLHISIGIAFATIATYLLDLSGVQTKGIGLSLGQFFISFPIFLLLGSFFSWLLLDDWLKRLFPVIELGVGPEYLNEALRKRKMLRYILSIVGSGIILPVILKILLG